MIKIPRNSKLAENHFNNIQIRIVENIDRILKQQYIKLNSKKICLDRKSKKLLEYLKDKKTLKNLIIAEPKELENIIISMNRYYEFITYKKTKGYKFLYNIFVNNCYEDGNSFNKLNFIRDIDIKTCPYCNRNYIFSIDDGKIKPQIDHFYSKSIYPFLAVSFYNLIPSCPTCNGFGAKEDKDTFNDYKISNPYEIKENEFQFTYTPTNINFNQIESKKYDFDNFEIEFKNANEANLEVFKLEELYKQHKDIVLELLIKKAYYPKSYIKELKSFGFSEDEIYRFIIGNYKQDKDLHKRPLSKLIKDISEELKLI